MKKILLLVVMFFIAVSQANASGLYFSVGYGVGDPDVSLDTVTGASNDTGVNGAYAGFIDVDPDTGKSRVPGWPRGLTPATDGYWASPWVAGLLERWEFDSKDTSVYSIAAGWDIPRNPFRFEVEYIKTSFDVQYWNMLIFPGADGAICDTNNGTGNCVEVDVYDFGLAFENSNLRDFDITSYMANVYFEIPGFGNFDPYIGAGFGLSKLDTKQSGISGGTDNESSYQLIAGIEYRIPDTEFIVGVEYRKFEMSKGKEVDEPEIEFNYKHDYVMFKLRYDFVSDVF